MCELGEDIYASGPMIEWVCGELIFYPFFSRYPTFSSRFCATTSLDSQSQPHTTFEREWARAKLINDTWKDALGLAVRVSISLCYRILRRIDAPFRLQFKLPKVEIYQAIVERLEATDRIADAVECFHQMTSELGENIDLEWVLGKWSCIPSAALLI